MLMQKPLQRLAARRGGKGGRDEHAHAVGGREHAALDDICNNAFEHGFILARFHHIVPRLNGVEALFGKHHSALGIVCLHDDQIEHVAHLDHFQRVDRGVGAEFIKRYVARMLPADIDLNLRGGHADNGTLHLLVCIHALQRRLQRLGKAHLVKGFLSGRFLLCGLLGCSLFGRCGRLRFLLDKLGVFIQQFGHGFKYLLYNTSRSGSPRSNANGRIRGKIDS